MFKCQLGSTMTTIADEIASFFGNLATKTKVIKPPLKGLKFHKIIEMDHNRSDLLQINALKCLSAD